MMYVAPVHEVSLFVALKITCFESYFVFYRFFV